MIYCCYIDEVVFQKKITTKEYFSCVSKEMRGLEYRFVLCIDECSSAAIVEPKTFSIDRYFDSNIGSKFNTLCAFIDSLNYDDKVVFVFDEQHNYMNQKLISICKENNIKYEKMLLHKKNKNEIDGLKNINFSSNKEEVNFIKKFILDNSIKFNGKMGQRDIIKYLEKHYGIFRSEKTIYRYIAQLLNEQNNN